MHLRAVIEPFRQVDLCTVGIGAQPTRRGDRIDDARIRRQREGARSGHRAADVDDDWPRGGRRRGRGGRRGRRRRHHLDRRRVWPAQHKKARAGQCKGGQQP